MPIYVVNIFYNDNNKYIHIFIYIFTTWHNNNNNKEWATLAQQWSISQKKVAYGGTTLKIIIIKRPIGRYIKWSTNTFS